MCSVTVAPWKYSLAACVASAKPFSPLSGVLIPTTRTETVFSPKAALNVSPSITRSTCTEQVIPNVSNAIVGHVSIYLPSFGAYFWITTVSNKEE
jgi:hypothetical protein